MHGGDTTTPPRSDKRAMTPSSLGVMVVVCLCRKGDCHTCRQRYLRINGWICSCLSDSSGKVHPSILHSFILSLTHTHASLCTSAYKEASDNECYRLVNIAEGSYQCPSHWIHLSVGLKNYI